MHSKRKVKGLQNFAAINESESCPTAAESFRNRCMLEPWGQRLSANQSSRDTEGITGITNDRLTGREIDAAEKFTVIGGRSIRSSSILLD